MPIKEGFGQEVVAGGARLVRPPVAAVGAPKQPQHFHLVDGRGFAATLQVLLGKHLPRRGKRKQRNEKTCGAVKQERDEDALASARNS